MGRSARDMALVAEASAAGSSFALSFVDEAGIQRREPPVVLLGRAVRTDEPRCSRRPRPLAGRLAGGLITPAGHLWS